VLHAFRRGYPEIEVYLEISNRARVFRQVELRDADIGIGGSPPESGELDGTPFLDNRLVVISSPEDPLVSRRGLVFEDLEESTWLLREPGSGTRILTRRLLDEKGIKPPTMTIGSNGAIKQSVCAGLGISLQSERAVTLELTMGMLSRLDLTEEIPRREWYALYPGQGPRRSVVDTFLGFPTGTAAREAIDDSLSAPLAGT
jgi:DNA-binding transcriptional LysR family regulator